MAGKGDDKHNSGTASAVEGFLGSLSHFYVSGLYLDLTNATYMAICQESLDGLGSSQGPWTDFDDYIKQRIHPSDQVAMHKASRIETIKSRLDTEQSYTVDVKDSNPGGERWLRCTFMRGSDADHAAICINDVSAEVIYRQAYERAEAKLRKSFAERDSQLEEITAFNRELEENQA